MAPRMKKRICIPPPMPAEMARDRPGGSQPILQPQLRLTLGGPLNIENEHLFVVLGQFIKVVQLDGALGAGLLAEAAENAALQIDGERNRILLVLRTFRGGDAPE